MSYVKKSLAANETIINNARFHWFHHLTAWGALIFLGPLLIGIYIFVRMMIWMKTTEIAVTDRRLVIKRGLIKRSTSELALGSVEEVNVEQSFFGRLFGYGKLVISGTGSAELYTPNIADPIDFRKAVSEARERFIPKKSA